MERLQRALVGNYVLFSNYRLGLVSLSDDFFSDSVARCQMVESNALGKLADLR
jgi:hypothetical protein